MPSYIHALGTAVPEAALSTERAASLLPGICPDARTARRMAKLIPLTGIERRHFAAMETQSDFDDPTGLYQLAGVQPEGPGMNARSQAFDALADRLVARLLNGFEGDDLAKVASLITVSCTHASSPGLELAVFRHSTVPHEVDRWNLGFMGCSAALAALRLARHNTSASALVVACELSSLHFQYSADLDQLTANLLFADGAAAVLLKDETSGVRVLHAQCVSIPAFAGQMVWWAGDFGLRLVLSPELPTTLATHLPGAIEKFLAGASLSARQIDHWLVHPGGPQILDAVEESIRLPEGSLALSRFVLRRFGNMSSPTILFILQAAIESGLEGHVMLIAFGPGLTIEIALVEICGPAEGILRGPQVTDDD
ncbi:MAG: naringenin-chalcone synthase [Phycisphaerae bacterium]|nr:MAG: naringenin-chalcone synthase [Phycisphaerae bacterium]